MLAMAVCLGLACTFPSPNAFFGRARTFPSPRAFRGEGNRIQPFDYNQINTVAPFPQPHLKTLCKK